MPITRMDREQFFAKLAILDEERLKKSLWNLYWRGSATMRERVEAEIDPGDRDRRQRLSKAAVDPQWVQSDVSEFAALARSGAYLGGNRRVSPRERTRWRFKFQDLVKDAQSALEVGAEEVAPAAAAMADLVDLACEMRGYDYFRSEDPVEAARFVVSDAVALLWTTMRDAWGFAEFAQRAAPQLIRWESKHGWTRTGWGKVRGKETSLASVLAQMLPATDMWICFTDRYLNALDQTARDDAVKATRNWQSPGSKRGERTKNLAEWHLLVLDRLRFSEAEDRLDRLAGHRALDGPELTFLQARLAHQRGDVSNARKLVSESLQELPGRTSFLDFAAEISAPLPAGRRAKDRQMQSARVS